MKTTSMLPAIVSCVALFASAGFAYATEYTVQTLSLANSTSITVLHPAEHRPTLAVYPNGATRIALARSAAAQPNTLRHAPSANGSQVSFVAPNP